MKIIQLTPGAGGMFCGGCLRDNALVTALRKQGHDALLAPLYLPLKLDEADASKGAPIFFGGINVYLQQKLAIFRKMPGWMDKPFNAAPLLRMAGSFAARTRPEDVGDLTVSMLKGEEGNQLKELEKLISWLRQESPDVISLSNALLVGMARRIKEALGVSVFCSFQGEDGFLDEMTEPFKSEAWRTLQERAADIKTFASPSDFFTKVMRGRLKLPEEKVQRVYNGIALDGYESAPPKSSDAPPVLGYFARLGPEKGLHTLVDAFLILKERPALANLKLHAAGSLGPSDQKFVATQKAKIAAKGHLQDATFTGNSTRAEKQEILRSFSVFSVPATCGEAFGLYILEALASGVPVVQPRHGAFPELIEATQGGLLCEPDQPESLAQSLESLLLDPEKARQTGAEGRRRVFEEFSADAMAKRFTHMIQG